MLGIIVRLDTQPCKCTTRYLARGTLAACKSIRRMMASHVQHVRASTRRLECGMLGCLTCSAVDLLIRGARPAIADIPSHCVSK